MHSQTQDLESLDLGKMRECIGRFARLSYHKFPFGPLYSFAARGMYLASAIIPETEMGNFSGFCDRFAVRLFFSTKTFEVFPIDENLVLAWRVSCV